MRLTTHGRFDYLPIKGRPAYEWPDGKRLAFYLAINVEHFAFGEGLGAELAPGGPSPDVLNFAWRDYGNRVGIWRMLDLLDEIGLPAAGLLNSAIYDYAPAIAAAFRARGDEIVAHGRTNAERQSTLDETGERKLIADATELITRHEGARPRGWLGPWIAQSKLTLDLLKEEGYEYVLDWCMDDQPLWMRTRAGRILSVPYPQEINDIPAIAVRRAGAREFADMIVAQFDEMLAQSESGPLVMGVALHPYLTGQPFRLRHLRTALAHIAGQRGRVWLTRPGAIAGHAAGLKAGNIP
jgi:peptidoglycan/xylan/chitin deacetylase (PgdA/CDA1 family)